MKDLSNVRVLCLHGMGVNGDIFARQTALLRSSLPPGYSFTFLDGKFACDPAPGVNALYPPPYLCWYNTPTIHKVGRAHKYVKDFIKREGPFDVVMGFSQGAALAASMILHHSIAYPGEPPLFSAAIFICSPIPFSSSLDFGIDTRTYFGMKVRRPSRPDCCTTVPGYLITDSAYLRGEDQLEPETTRHPEEEVFFQMFHATVDDVRIGIPTAHVYGYGDAWRLHSKDLIELCRADSVLEFEHEGGHEIPEDASYEISDLIETAVNRGLCA